MNLFQKFIGIPFVYDRIRPFVVGGIDMRPFYRILGAAQNDVILDIGCGTGIALDYLQEFQAYFGFDTDPIALSHAREYKGHLPKVHFECRPVTEEDIKKIQPTRIIMGGLLHHLSDADANSLLKICARSSSVKRIATEDAIYLTGKPISNLFTWLDRGRYIRTREGYHRLLQGSGLKITAEEIMSSHPTHRRAQYYFLMGLEPEV